jgi:predicted ATPase
MTKGARSKKTRKSQRGSFKVVCLTGGPGAGKTSVTDILQRQFSREFLIVPESASILYRGGFPRAETKEIMQFVQEAIFHTQVASEGIAFLQAKGIRGIICDRGTMDGAAYWPKSRENFLEQMKTNLDTEFARYDLVVHMESPNSNGGYDHSNPLRTETAKEARTLDRRIQQVWRGHPRQILVPHRRSFMEKVETVLSILRQELPHP